MCMATLSVIIWRVKGLSKTYVKSIGCDPPFQASGVVGILRNTPRPVVDGGLQFALLRATRRWRTRDPMTGKSACEN